MRTAVVLPAPFGPRTPRIVARSATRSMPRKASTFPKLFVSPSATMAGTQPR